MSKGIYGSLKRLRNFPIDETSRFQTLEQANAYCQNDKTAYVGQFLSIYDDDHKAEGGKNNNGVYIITPSSETVSQKTLLRATDSDAIDKLTKGLNDLSEDFEELEQKLGEDIENKLQSFATLDELDNVNARIDELIGLSQGETLNEALDTIKEISKWIEHHNEFVTTILDINERMSIIQGQNELLKTNLYNTASEVRDLSTTVNNIVSHGYINRSEVEELVRTKSYGYREISFSVYSGQKIPLPDENMVIDKINIFLEGGAEDAHFKIFVRAPYDERDDIYISSDCTDDGYDYECSYFDPETLGNYVYILNIEKAANEDLRYSITYDPEHNQIYNLKGRIGVSYYTFL